MDRSLKDMEYRKVLFFVAIFNHHYVCKQALVNFMAKIRGNRVSYASDRLVLTAGATSANEMIGLSLLSGCHNVRRSDLWQT